MEKVHLAMAGVGALFALGALALVWGYLVDTLRGVKMPEFRNIRLVVNVLFVLALGLLSFLLYHDFTWESLYAKMFAIHAACWIVTFLVALVALLCCSDTEGLGAGVLTAMWKILAILVVFAAMPR